MKWYIFHKETFEPLCWDGACLTFDEEYQAIRFLESAQNCCPGKFDAAEIVQEAEYTWPHGYKDASNLLLDWDEDCEEILVEAEKEEG